MEPDFPFVLEASGYFNQNGNAECRTESRHRTRLRAADAWIQ